MNRLTGALISATIAASIAGCATLTNDQAKTPEQIALSVETGYQAASLGLRLAVATHVITGGDNLAKWREVNRKAFKATCLTRVAYNFTRHRDLATNLLEGCKGVVTPTEMAQATSLTQAAALAIATVDALSKAATPKQEPN